MIFLIIFCAKYMAPQYTILWHSWPVLITGFENVPANNWGSSREGRSKIHEILKQSYHFLCKVAIYLNGLEGVTPLCLILEDYL